MANRRPTTPIVKDLQQRKGQRVRDLLDGYAGMGGFSPKSLTDAIDVWNRMRKDGAKVLLSIPAAPFATGLRGAIVEAVKQGLIHGIITTCGTLDHDLARTWGAYHHGSFQLDDEDLLKKGIHRLGSVLVPRASYGELLEERLTPLLKRLFEKQKSLSTIDLCRFLGAELGSTKGAEQSLLYQAFKQDVPIVIPGPTDGAVGSQIWLRYQMDRSIRLDLLKDEQWLNDFVHEAKKLGGIILGGGISKHHLIWWAQFRDGLDYAFAVTTAPEYDGSLSGARLREAISWGKLKAQARHVTVEGDLTLIFPLILAGVLEGRP
jgi:deoxyhypusine synthase